MEEDEAVDHGNRKPKLLRSPVQPTLEEIEEHESTGHVQHRTWCGHCMRARGLHEQHSLVDKEGKNEHGVPILSADYFYMGRSSTDAAEPESELPSLQVKDEYTGFTWSSTVPAKGPDAYAVNFTIQCIEETGYRRILFKSDNEPAIKSLKAMVKQSLKGVEVVMEESKTGDHPSNGSCESAVRETKRQVKAMKSSLEERLTSKIADRHPVLSWISRHANFLLSRFRVGRDGRTPYERSRGRRWKRPSIVFGERVWFQPLKSYQKGAYDGMKEGIYVGTHGRNGDALVMTEEGVIKGGSLKRTPEDKRWSKEGFEKLCGTPWNLRPQRAEDLDAAIRIELPEVGPGRLMPEPADREAGMSRNLYVKKKDVEGNFTPGCAGCNAIQVGLPVRSHSAECRTLVAQRLLQTEEGKERVLRAQKRKGIAGEIPEGREDAMLADVVDDAEEMHAPAAIGQPVEGEDRVSPVGRPDPDLRRPLDSASSSSQPAAKRMKSPEKKGTKRSGDPITEQEGQKERQEQQASVEAATGSIGGEATVSQPMELPLGESTSSAPASVLGLASILEGHVCLECTQKETLEISQLLCHMGVCGSDIAEVYNPARFTSRCNSFGLRPGFVVDMTVGSTIKGEPWDLTRPEHQAEFKRLLVREKPFMLLGAPPCNAFSPLQNLNKGKRSDEENAAIEAEGKTHLHNAVDGYLEQHRNGRFFLHEHPANASSWKDEKVIRLQDLDGVHTVQGPMCRWDMVSEDSQGVGYVKKDTKYITNSEEVARILNGSCSGTHRHVHLINGRAKFAQKYPPKMAAAILRAIKIELGKVKELGPLSEVVASGPSPEDTGSEPTESYFDPDLRIEGMVFDSVTGMPLDVGKVQEARKEEMKWVDKQKLYEVVDESVCWEETGRAPIGLKWVDRNKGDSVHENYRSRLVVREIKKVQGALAEFESFSAMPPLEALKALCSLMTSLKMSKRNKPLKMKILDISRAHFYGVSRRRVFTNLPEGSEQPGKCALLVKSMYGTLDAASIWQQTYSKLLKKHNIQQGVGWPALFYHAGHDLRFLVHGDDFICLGDEEAHSFLARVLDEEFEYRIDGTIGPDATDGTAMTVLNRIIGYNKSTGTVSYEADPRHAEHLVKALKLENGKAVSTPSEKQKLNEILAAEGMPELPAEMASQYRSLTMRAAYLSLDRPDLSESVKSLARHMQAPSDYAWSKLKRLGRYLLGRMRVVQYFYPQTEFRTLRVYTDSDHAGCLKTRKSTTGIVLCSGRHCLKHSSNLQSTVSLSSGESEYYALVKAAAVGLGARAMFADWGLKVDVRVLSDSSAARGISSRKGLGKTRHVQTRYLWVQEKVSSKEIHVEAVHTSSNVADLCTKPLPQDVCLKHMKAMNFEFQDGRSTTAKLLS